MPLLGSYGGSSEYAYRGTIDDFPDDFSFESQFDVTPGGVYTSNEQTITGINNRALVRVSAGASVSVNGSEYLIPTQASPVFIKNNETLSVRIKTTSGSGIDFSKTYATVVRVGKKSTVWNVRTKLIDVDPTPFTFTNLNDREIGIALTSNEVTIAGLEPNFSFPATIASGGGLIYINGAGPVLSGEVQNGDRVYLRLNSPFKYSNYPTGAGKTFESTTLQVSNYSTTWSISSRDVDIFVNPFDFNDVNNGIRFSDYEAFSVNTSGIVTTITGADQGIELVTAVSGCELRVEQPAAAGGFSIRRPYSKDNAIVFNGDRLSVRLRSGDYSETKIGIVTVSNFTGRFIVTTRPRPIDTIPDAFSFTDLVNQERNKVLESNEITLTGITTGDQGVASITSGTNGGNAQFQITRGSQIIRSYGTANANVQNGDKIKLKITSSPDSAVSRTATFRVDGIDTNLVLTGTTGSQSDIWSVGSATRTCGISTFTFNTEQNANPNTQYSRTFVVDGFNSDCRMIVSTSGAGSFLSVSGTTLTNNIEVSPGTSVTVFMSSGDYFETRTATITVSNSTTGVSPTSTYNTTWTINTQADPRPTSVTLTASPSSTLLGDPVVLTWNSINAASVSSFSGQGFNPTTKSGTATVNPTSSQVYSITLTPNQSAANFPSPQTASASVTVTEDLSPDSFILNPGGFVSQQRNSVVTVTAISTLVPSTSVSGLTPTTQVPARVSSNTGSPVSMRVNGSDVGSVFNVKNGDIIDVSLTNSSQSNATASATLTIGGLSQTFTSTTVSQPASVSLTANKATINKGESVTLSWSSTGAGSVVSGTGDGFNPSGGSSGGQTITPNPEISGDSVDINYTITLTSLEGTESFPNNVTSPPLTITVLADKTPDPFTLTPASVTGKATGSTTIFTTSPASITGLTPGISVPISVSSSTGSNLFFRVTRNGSVIPTSTVQNNDSVSVFLANSSSGGVTSQATLTIGTASASGSSTTVSCSAITQFLDVVPGVSVQVKEAIVNYENGTQGQVSLFTGAISGGETIARAGTSPTTSPGTSTSQTITGTVTTPNNNENSATFSGSGASVSNTGSLNGPCSSGGSTSYRYYRITYTTPFTSSTPNVSITNVSTTTAGGQSSTTMDPTVVQSDSSGFKVWFCRVFQNTANKTDSGLSWTRSFKFTVSGSTGSSPGTTTPGTPGTSWTSLINTISDAYKSSTGFKRPPTLDEIKSRASTFINNSSITLTSLSNSIQNQDTAATRASSYTDKCGNNFGF